MTNVELKHLSQRLRTQGCRPQFYRLRQHISAPTIICEGLNYPRREWNRTVGFEYARIQAMTVC